MARNVVQEVEKAIRRKCVVMAHKTKWKGLSTESKGGKQLVSVGPYRTAVGTSKKFIVIGKDWETETPSANYAAKTFVRFVGNDIAWSAVQRAKAKCGI